MNNTELSIEESAALELKVERLADEIQLVIPTSIEETWAEVVRLEEQAFINAAKRGMLLLTLKNNLPHGNFEVELKARGLSQHSARDSMTIAKMLLALP